MDNLNIHIPVKSGSKELSSARQHISPRSAVTKSPKLPPQMQNLLIPKTIEEFIEFQGVNTSHFILGQEENQDIAATIRHLNSLIYENSQMTKNLESLTDELSRLMDINKRLKSVEVTCTSIDTQRSQTVPTTDLLNNVKNDLAGNPAVLTTTSGVCSMTTTPTISSSGSQSSSSTLTTNPTTFTSLLNRSLSTSATVTSTPTLISSLSSATTPIPLPITTSASLIYSSPTNQSLSTATLQTSNTSMANILAANNHFSQTSYNPSFPLSSNHATSSTRSRQGEINYSASLPASLYSSGVNQQQQQQQHIAPLSNHHSQVGGNHLERQHSLSSLATNPALLSQLNQLRHPSYSHLMTASSQYEQQQQASNGSNSSRPAPLTRRNSGNLSVAPFNHHSLANGIGTSTTAANRPYDNSLSHLPTTNGGSNSSHFYNHN